MTTTTENGRLGNQLIRNLSVSLIAEKYDLYVNYCNKHVFTALGIDLFSGNKSYECTQYLNEENYFTTYNCGNLNYNLDPNNSFFQTKEITNFLYDYLHKDIIKQNIIEKNPYKQRYNVNNDLYIHIRLTDAQQWNPGIKYYLNTIKNINCDNLYISTDDPNHSIVKEILELYPQGNLINNDEVNTIQFASTCKYIVLSHGSFSALIGYLSFYSVVFYPNCSCNVWGGDMFSINNWIECSLE